MTVLESRKFQTHNQEIVEHKVEISSWKRQKVEFDSHQVFLN